MPNHPHSPRPPGRASPRPTVLLVDREALYRWFVAESLRESGVDVVSCDSLGEAADVICRRAAPDLLIVDGDMLEGRDGEVFRAIRHYTGAAPCLVLDSGGGLSPNRLGAVTVAVKPVDTDAVIALVASQLHRDAPAA